MNNVKKLVAFVIAAAMTASLAGCADQSWSYKTNDVSISAGSYIYNMLNAYYEGYALVESPDDAENVLEAEVKASDEQAKTLEQYTYDGADKSSMRMIAVEDLFKSYNLVLDETQDESARSYADSIWSSAKKTLEGYGISEESFTYCYADYMVKYSQVFDHHYGKDGDAYVTDEELNKYFTENFDGYAYFSVDMTETNDEGKSVAKSEAEFDKTQKQLDKYANMINKDKKDYKAVVTQYIKDAKLTSDPTSSGSLKSDEDTAIDAAVVEKIRSIAEGSATVVRTGSADTSKIYFVYKPKASEIEDYYDDDSSFEAATNANDDDEVFVYSLKSGLTRTSLITKMKTEEFETFLDDHAKAINVQKNEAAIKKYKAKMFVPDDTDSE